MTIYDANTQTWSVGDVVIHDSDRKNIEMLMLVVGVSKRAPHVFRTRYLFPKLQPKCWRAKIWRNTVASLHDPRRFGIEVPKIPGVA